MVYYYDFIKPKNISVLGWICLALFVIFAFIGMRYKITLFMWLAVAAIAVLFVVGFITRIKLTKKAMKGKWRYR
jgi:hypothetical protein